MTNLTLFVSIDQMYEKIVNELVGFQFYENKTIKRLNLLNDKTNPFWEIDDAI